MIRVTVRVRVRVRVSFKGDSSGAQVLWRLDTYSSGRFCVFRVRVWVRVRVSVRAR